MQKDYLREAVVRYHPGLIGSPAAEHLEARGLDPSKLAPLRLGYVADPLPGHEMYRGMLAIPYIRQSANGDWIVVSMRFRCLEDHEHHGHGKYNTEAGDTPRLYNTRALVLEQDRISICEGESDVWTMFNSDLPAVGVPGVQAWRPHFREAFLGYERVFILADGDDPGRQFAKTLATTLPNAKIIPMDNGMDVNTTVQTQGREALTERLK